MFRTWLDARGTGRGEQSRWVHVPAGRGGFWDTHSMAIPELDALRVGRWCRERVPEHLGNELQVQCDIADRHITIVEVRPPWDDSDAPWTRFPIARLRYTAASGLWSLYWRDRHLRFHAYKRLSPSPNVNDLLDHIEHSGDPIFWG